MDLTDPIHKKIIGIIFIVFSVLGLVCFLFYGVFMEFMLAMVPEEELTLETEMIFQLIEVFLWVIAFVYLIPKVVLGFGLVNQKPWADTPSLIYAIIGLINIPLGTLLGVYAILVFTSKPKEEPSA